MRMAFTIRSLNEHERGAIRVALEEYINRHGVQIGWSQKIVNEEMLDKLLWMDKDE
jgi:hypothetical protein